ncbi:hypothetical protein A2872_02525 [Candidatus Gottesmanbacteria bacterium RIFCSPHIGHO2_01_FULL_42_12]|uniref:Ribulose-phosphate 3-epimerase n=1 Tax=Candidatus Gottesmanbacteria bacterium RIFCSPHIGHO2_01_FULL_42_12 TaxID=1798377 RepID=A0A1F5Z551_9BACT|nr:MAG: hypothetical protein A2872_02525 [Candidatus Gottesmanbacteria bacterium RIFCSPHIGHO2_01_FULL_42_12]
MIEIIPGIFEKDWPAIENKILVATPQVTWVQIDFADGILVPTVSFLDVARFKTVTNKASFEAHLMVINPVDMIPDLSAAGFKRVIGHVEANNLEQFIAQARKYNLEVGLAIDGPSSVSAIEPYLNKLDFVLIMMAIAGASNLPLHPEHLDKIRAIRNLRPNLPIEVDEGINEKTAKTVIAAGATRLVSTSYLFKDPALFAQKLKSLKHD